MGAAESFSKMSWDLILAEKATSEVCWLAFATQQLAQEENLEGVKSSSGSVRFAS
jgi:hypothetical protein